MVIVVESADLGRENFGVNDFSSDGTQFVIFEGLVRSVQLTAHFLKQPQLVSIVNYVLFRCDDVIKL